TTKLRSRTAKQALSFAYNVNTAVIINECSSMLFAVKYGVTIMRALRTFLAAALMATTAWTSTHPRLRARRSHWRCPRVHRGRGGLQFLRQRNHQEADRGDRASRAGQRGFSRWLMTPECTVR